MHNVCVETLKEEPTLTIPRFFSSSRLPAPAVLCRQLFCVSVSHLPCLWVLDGYVKCIVTCLGGGGLEGIFLCLLLHINPCLQEYDTSDTKYII